MFTKILQIIIWCQCDLYFYYTVYNACNYKLFENNLYILSKCLIVFYMIFILCAVLEFKNIKFEFNGCIKKIRHFN